MGRGVHYSIYQLARVFGPLRLLRHLKLVCTQLRHNMTHFKGNVGCSRRMWAPTDFEHEIHTLFKVCLINVQCLFKIQTLFKLCSNLVQIQGKSSMNVHYTFILCSTCLTNEQTMFIVKLLIHSLFKLHSNFKLF